MIGNSSQKFVPIKSIRDGIVSLGNNEYRAVIMVSSLNLSLKSEDEQTAILSQFQNFFNSLDFPIQIYTKSRRVNIDPYIESLNARVKEVQNDLLKLQIIEYIEYIKTFTSENNIMNKEFYVVVPYTSAVISGGFANFTKNNDENISEFYKIKEQINEKVFVVKSGLNRCGLKTTDLSTENLIELYYNIMNPGAESKTLV